MLIFSFLFAAVSAIQDRELIERLKGRDPQALGDLYDRYGHTVYSVILRIVRDTGTAEALAQEAFLRIWNRIGGFDEAKGALGPWVLAVARNRAIDFVRSNENRMSQTLFDLDKTEYPGVFANLETDILNSERARRIRAAFEKLNPNHRRVIELAYWEGLSQTEMAERMQQPLGTVKTWTRSALRSLREELAGEAVPV
jgi:RNA polymerase sigma-70 factor (ECF subfamily)